MPLIDHTARGVFVIAVTLFDARGALDLDSLDRVTDFYLAAGADGLTILGMMGEAPQLTQVESREVIARVITRAGAAGVSAPGLAAIGELSAAAMDLGAAGVEVAQNVLVETQSAILPLVPYLDTLRWVFIAVALVGIGVAVWARLDDWKRGRR